MNIQKCKPLALAFAVFALTAGGSLAVHAQDQNDQRPRQDDQRPRQDDQNRDHRDDHGDRNADALAEKYRKAHPEAAARCHDGFFTRTTGDRACTKHGGVDVWLRDHQ